eukprot:1026506-Amphidinium_carterae.3
MALCKSSDTTAGSIAGRSSSRYVTKACCEAMVMSVRASGVVACVRKRKSKPRCPRTRRRGRLGFPGKLASTQVPSPSDSTAPKLYNRNGMSVST